MSEHGIVENAEAAAEELTKRGLAKPIAIAVTVGAMLAGFGTAYTQWDKIVVMIAADKIELARRDEHDKMVSENEVTLTALETALASQADALTRLKIYCNLAPACRKNFAESFFRNQ